jgi:glutathionylspermidine synthase
MDISTEKRYEDDFKQTLISLDNPPGTVVSEIEKMNDYLLKRRALAKGRVLPTFIKPYFLTTKQINHFEQTVNIILRCQEKLIGLYYEYPEYRPLFELTPAEIPLVEIGGQKFQHIYFSRMDSIMPDEGDYKFLEFNCDSPGGAYYSDIQWDALNELSVYKDMQMRHKLVYDQYRPKVLKTILAAWKNSGGFGKPRIAVMGDPDVTNIEEFLLFAEYFRAEGFEALFSDPWSCDFDGEYLRKEGRIIELIYRRGILADYSKHGEDVKPVIDAYKAGKVVFANPLSAKLGDNKNLLEIMTDEKMEWLFLPDERAVLKKHLPWTRIVKERKTTHQGKTIDLLDYLRRNRRLFVLKPNAEYGGKGVVIGRETEMPAWETAIENALKTPYVVQEYVKIPEREFPVVRDGQLVWEPKKINVNFFTFNGQFGGGFCRTSDSSIINISAGGALVSFCVVEE